MEVHLLGLNGCQHIFLRNYTAVVKTAASHASIDNREITGAAAAANRESAMHHAIEEVET
jgi:hypothetical protein